MLGALGPFAVFNDVITCHNQKTFDIFRDCAVILWFSLVVNHPFYREISYVRLIRVPPHPLDDTLPLWMGSLFLKSTGLIPKWLKDISVIGFYVNKQKCFGDVIFFYFKNSHLKYLKCGNMNYYLSNELWAVFLFYFFLNEQFVLEWNPSLIPQQTKGFSLVCLCFVSCKRLSLWIVLVVAARLWRLKTRG